MKIDQTEYVIFDVETTGLSPLRGDRIIEIGAVRVKSGKIIEEFESFIDPQRDVPAESIKIHNITPQMLEGAPAAKDVLPRFIEFVGGSCLVAHNIKFDLDFVCYQLSMIGRRINDQTPAIDTLKMAKKLFPHLRSYRLSAIASSLGVSVEETHRALSDVKLTTKVLNHLLDFAIEQRVDTIPELLKQFGVQKPSFKINHEQEASLF